MPKFFKKLTLSFLSFLILFFSVAPYLSAVKAATTDAPPSSPSVPAAQGTWYNQNFFGWYGKVYDTNTSPSDQIFGERYTAAQVQWVIFGALSFIINITGASEIFSCVMSNSNLTSCAKAVEDTFASSGIDPMSNLAQGTQNENLLSMVFATDRPFSGVSYVKEKIQNFSLVPVAHAQNVGFGYTVLQPIQKMWTATRNIAFGLFVLAAVVFAFMIMFRVKISPQVVISVQSAIPKLVLALILVTFSYAIAGFLIDLMYVVIGFLSVMLASLNPFPDILHTFSSPTSIFNILTMGQPFGLVQVGIIGFLVFITLPFWILILTFTVAILLLILGTGGTGSLVLWIAFIPLIISVVVVLIICIKTIWALFKAFAYIILLTIFAPLQIALGVLIPNFGFGQWVKSYLSNLSVFVTTGVIGYLSILFTLQGMAAGLQGVPGGDAIQKQILQYFLGAAAPDAISGLTFGLINTSRWPPLLGNGGTVGGLWLGILFLGISFMLFTLIPKATEIIQGFISGKPYAYGSAIGEAMGPITAGGNAYIGYAGSTMSRKGELPRPISDIYSGLGRQQPEKKDVGVAGDVIQGVQNYLQKRRG
jgi:hypothetical protein